METESCCTGLFRAALPGERRLKADTGSRAAPGASSSSLPGHRHSSSRVQALFSPDTDSPPPRVQALFSRTETPPGGSPLPPPPHRLFSGVSSMSLPGCRPFSPGSGPSLPDTDSSRPLSSSSSSSSPLSAAALPRPGLRGSLRDKNAVRGRGVSGLNLSLVPGSEGCSAVHVSAVIRHGTRFPTLKNIRRIERVSRLVQGLSDRGQDPAVRDVLRDIRDTWEQWYREDMDGRLVEKGRVDLMNLASRLAGSFPALLSEADSKHRCVSSAEAFQDGLRRVWDRSRATRGTMAGAAGTTTGTTAQTGAGTGTQADQDQDQGPEYVHEVDDGLLRSFERCRGYVEGVETNATATEEVERFKQGAELRDLQLRVSQRLGLGPGPGPGPDLLSPGFLPWAHNDIDKVFSPQVLFCLFLLYWEIGVGKGLVGFALVSGASFQHHKEDAQTCDKYHVSSIATNRSWSISANPETGSGSAPSRSLHQRSCPELVCCFIHDTLSGRWSAGRPSEGRDVPGR
ncbi:hypothetical protein WMY93_032135 [Mugilogobius chulae]|uniref:Multiple inositol polyphosphate phosphatase 1 n=1 Tax=Mugilogobius chulae TaxID=88201 RepID=A0AAW0MDH1_9GOBI